MSTRSLVDELGEDREDDKKIIKTFYSKPTLSLDVFEKSGDTYKMLDPVRDKLLIITDKFIDFLGVDFFIYDVILTGSLANYNWSEYSDVDLHVLIDYDESDHNNALLAEFFAAKKQVWNIIHDITIKNFEVEMYVQDVKEPHISSGVYSVLNDKWVVEPQKSKNYVDDRCILELWDISHGRKASLMFSELASHTHLHVIIFELDTSLGVETDIVETGTDFAGH